MSLVFTPLASDNFHRPDENPLTSPWAPNSRGEHLGLQIISNVCESTSGDGTSGSQIYNYADGTPDDQYVAATVLEFNPSADTVVGLPLFLRLTDDGSGFESMPGYRFEFSNDFGDFFLNVIDDGTGDYIGFTRISTINPGDVLKVAAIGTTLYAWQNDTLLLTVTNATYPSGKTAMGLYPDFSMTDLKVSNFEMGSVADVTPPAPPPPFIGSVTEVGSVPAGDTDVFLGTVAVVDIAPAGVPNPYLGKIRSGSPAAGQSNPALGQVVIVGSAPAGEPDPFLGTVKKN
jgi:hypothetical protein